MKNRGFSLIELLVVLILLSFSLALVAPSLSRFSRTVELKGAAQKISGTSEIPEAKQSTRERFIRWSSIQT
jgi:prepilin-type N-terminal cleavage/methylation domain-containing protein